MGADDRQERRMKGPNCDAFALRFDDEILYPSLDDACAIIEAIFTDYPELVEDLDRFVAVLLTQLPDHEEPGQQSCVR
jgi:hypothetical protein